MSTLASAIEEVRANPELAHRRVQEYFNRLRTQDPAFTEAEIATLRAEYARIQEVSIYYKGITMCHPDWQTVERLSTQSRELLAYHQRKLLLLSSVDHTTKTFADVWEIARAFAWYRIYWAGSLISGHFV